MSGKFSIIKHDIPHAVVGSLADIFKKHPYTIQRWFVAGNDKLTSEKATKVYQELGFIYDPEGLAEKLRRALMA